MKRITLLLLFLFLALPCLSQERWGRDGTWGRTETRWGRGIEAAWTLTDLDYIVDWWRIEQGVSEGAVAHWYGSINGIDLAQSSGAKQPIYVADMLNGQPAIGFDGSNDYLAGQFGAEYAQPNTIIYVCTEPTDNGGDREMLDGFQNGKRHLIRQSGSGNKYVFYSGSILNSSQAITASNPWRIWSAVANGANGLLRMDGNQVASGNVGTNPLDGLTIAARYGGFQHCDIFVTDIVVINAVLNTGDLQRAERYFTVLRKPHLDMPAGLVEWWRIEYGITNDDPGVTDLVSSWLGSIHQIDLAQGTDNLKPVWTADQLNGHPALVFDGAAVNGDYLQGAFTSISQPLTIILVSSERSVGEEYEYYLDGDDATNYVRLFHRNSTDLYVMSAGTNLWTTLLGLGTGFKIWSIVANGGSSILRQNGIAVATGFSGTNTLDGLTLGNRFDGGRAADISITDVIVFSDGLSTAELVQIETYINNLRGGVYP